MSPPPAAEPSGSTQQRTHRVEPRPSVTKLRTHLPWRRRTLRNLRALPLVSTFHTMLSVLMGVVAGFSKIDGEVAEEEIDSSLGFMRYDYPEAIYSELRRIYFEALQKHQDVSARARDLARTLPVEQKILLGGQLYLLISRSEN